MNKKIWFAVCSLVLSISPASADSVSDKLIASVINKQLPSPLYQQTDIPWDLGVYSLDITKMGMASFSSNATQLTLSVPLKANIKGDVNQSLFGSNINMKCSSEVITQGHIVITPTIKTSGSTADASVTVPVPDNAQLDCDGLKIPIKSALEALIKKNKADWETQIESDIGALFKQLDM
jgi:hypothetical protein